MNGAETSNIKGFLVFAALILLFAAMGCSSRAALDALDDEQTQAIYFETTGQIQIYK